MANKPGNIFTRQAPNPPLVARNLNQLMGPVEGLVRQGIGKGLSQHALYGGGPQIRVAVGLFGIFRIGPDGIPGANFDDPNLTVPGKGFVIVTARTVDGGVPKGVLEPCENWFHGTATAGWFPVIGVKVDMETWMIVSPDCINAPLP